MGSATSLTRHVIVKSFPRLPPSPHTPFCPGVTFAETPNRLPEVVFNHPVLVEAATRANPPEWHAKSMLWYIERRGKDSVHTLGYSGGNTAPALFENGTTSQSLVVHVPSLCPGSTGVIRIDMFDWTHPFWERHRDGSKVASSDFDEKTFHRYAMPIVEMATVHAHPSAAPMCSQPDAMAERCKLGVVSGICTPTSPFECPVILGEKSQVNIVINISRNLAQMLLPFTRTSNQQFPVINFSITFTPQFRSGKKPPTDFADASLRSTVSPRIVINKKSVSDVMKLAGAIYTAETVKRKPAAVAQAAQPRKRGRPPAADKAA